MTTRVAGGLVVTPAGTREADVVLAGGRIVDLVAAEGAPGRDDVDARGCIVLPGGVDPHAHPLSDLRPATEELLPLAAVDIRLHPSIWEPDRLTADDLHELSELGARSVKLFLAYGELGMQASERTLRETLETARELGLVTMVHCEDGDAIERLVREQLAAGQHGVSGFVASRPAGVEEAAVERLLANAGAVGASVYLVHLSTAGSVELVRQARRRGQTVWAEACTHHLVLDDSRYEREQPERWLEAPPLRPRSDVEALWAAVADGTIDTVGSDHAQVPYRPPFETGDFRSLPYGIAGIEERLAVVVSEGRRRGIEWQKLASLLAATPASVFGVGGKGAIAAGADADLVLWEPGDARPLTPDDLHECAFTAFEGVVLDGRIRAVIRGGRIE